jgi:hypothetical protein
MKTFVIRTLMFLIRTWIAMLLIGGVHHDVDARIPALGYWQMALVLMLLDWMLSGPIASGIGVADVYRKAEEED